MSNSNRILFGLTWTHLCNDLYQMILPPLLPALIISFNLNYLLGGVLAATFIVVSSALNPVLGYMVDIHRKRKLGTVLSFLIFAVATPALGLATNIAHLLILCVLLGIAGATFHPISTTFITAAFKNKKGTAMGIQGIGGSFGHFLAPVAAGLLIAMFGWRTGVIFLLIPGAASAFALWKMLEEPSFRGQRGLSATITLSLIVLAAVSSLRQMVYIGFVTFLPSFFTSTGSSVLTADLLTSLMLITGVIAQPIGGAVSDRVGRRLVFAITLASATLLLIGFMQTSGWFSLVFLPLIGFCLFFTFPVGLTLASELAKGNNVGTTVGIVFGISSGVGAFSAVLTGNLIDHFGFYVSFLVLAVFAAAGAMLSLLLPDSSRTVKTE